MAPRRLLRRRGPVLAGARRGGRGGLRRHDHPGGIKTAIARNARVSDQEDQAETARFFDEKLARMTPERAAEIIVKGVLGDKARVLVGLDAHALHHLAKLTGSRYQDIVARASRRVLPAKVV